MTAPSALTTETRDVRSNPMMCSASCPYQVLDGGRGAESGGARRRPVDHSRRRGDPGIRHQWKQRITLAHLLTHTSGMPLGLPHCRWSKWAIWEANVKAICAMAPQSRPGQVVSYSASIGYTLLGEIIRRVDGGHRSLRQIFAEDLLQPLGMRDSGLSSRGDLEPRRVPIVIRDPEP